MTKSKKTIKLEALNVGSISPNTVHLEIMDLNNNVRILTNLRKGESASITIRKK